MKFTPADILYNLVALAAFGALITVIIRARRQPLWAEAYRRLGKNKVAMTTLVILIVYGSIALLDSLGATSAAPHDRRTIVDALFQRPAERTYSAPFATETTGE